MTYNRIFDFTPHLGLDPFSAIMATIFAFSFIFVAVSAYKPHIFGHCGNYFCIFIHFRCHFCL